MLFKQFVFGTVACGALDLKQRAVNQGEYQGQNRGYVPQSTQSGATSQTQGYVQQPIQNGNPGNVMSKQQEMVQNANAMPQQQEMVQNANVMPQNGALVPTNGQQQPVNRQQQSTNLRGANGQNHKNGKPEVQIDPMQMLSGLAANFFNPPQGNGGWGADGEHARDAKAAKPRAGSDTSLEADPFSALINTFLGGTGEAVSEATRKKLERDAAHTHVEHINGKDVIITERPHEGNDGNHHLEIVKSPSAQGILEALDADFDSHGKVIKEGVQQVSKQATALGDDFVKNVLGGKGNEVSQLLKNTHIDEQIANNVEASLKDMSETVHQYKPVLERGARVVDHVNDLAEKFANGPQSGDDINAMISEGFKLFNHISEEVAGATKELGLDDPNSWGNSGWGGNGGWDNSWGGNNGWGQDASYNNGWGSNNGGWDNNNWNANSNWWDNSNAQQANNGQQVNAANNGQLALPAGGQQAAPANGNVAVQQQGGTNGQQQMSQQNTAQQNTPGGEMISSAVQVSKLPTAAPQANAQQQAQQEAQQKAQQPVHHSEV